MSKKTTIASLTVIAVLALSAMAFAGQGWHHGYGMMNGYGPGYGMMNGYGPGAQIAPEQQEAFQKIFDKHQEKMEKLRNEMWSKNLELNALTESGKADKSDIRSLVAEISKVREKMQVERESFYNDLDAAGIQPQSGPGYGMGNGRGYGMMNGYGPGNGPCGW
ncbi:Spy/CpxP family protein refolding chaperone [Paucidesulfovibrio longus]|uniref:Spy/CpxP family protein refolding chaperone n=1 Tax=Paucidesulfovibrio longus TaxID=889 RepID=UPI0003B73F33|nr:periplasmic heavy metal sensor [Paucidesulfovibrio longus]